LGERDIRKWIALVATVGAGMHNPGELVRFALIRDRFCELLSHKLSKGMPDGFLMGLLSLMDAILGMTMSELLQKVPWTMSRKLCSDTRASCARAMTSSWRGKTPTGRRARNSPPNFTSEVTVAEAYIAAIKWAGEVSNLWNRRRSTPVDIHSCVKSLVLWTCAVSTLQVTSGCS